MWRLTQFNGKKGILELGCTNKLKKNVISLVCFLMKAPVFTRFEPRLADSVYMSKFGRKRSLTIVL